RCWAGGAYHRSCTSTAVGETQVPARYGLRQPDAVRADVEDMAVAVHGTGVHGQYDRPAPAGPDAGRRLTVGGEVHGVPVHGAQPFGTDRLEVAGDGPVVEVRRRSGGREPEVDLDAVPLTGADSGAVDGEAPL